MNLSRRSLFSLAPAFLAAPAILRLTRIMPLSVPHGIDLAPYASVRLLNRRTGEFHHIGNGTANWITVGLPAPKSEWTRLPLIGGVPTYIGLPS